MPLITSYLYQNIFAVQLLDYGNVAIQNIRNRVVYQRPIQIYRGADNPITIKFKNQDQKSANIAGLGFEYFIIDYLLGNVVMMGNVTVSNVTTATANVMITSDMVNGLPQNKYKLAFRASDGTYQTPVYSDDNFMVYAEMNINPAYNLDAFTNATYDFDGNVDLGTIC